jgi:hypothetical protein
MSQEAEDNDPNLDFDVTELYDLIYGELFDEASEILNNDRITPENKNAAVNFTHDPDGYDQSTMIGAAMFGAPINSTHEQTIRYWWQPPHHAWRRFLWIHCTALCYF